MTGCFRHYLRGEINLYVSYKVTLCTMSASRVVVRMSREGLGTLRAAILKHAGNLESLLRPSWPDAEGIGNEMYGLVDTLMAAGVDQRWFSGYALVEGEEVMLTTPGICAVSFDFSMSFGDNILTKNNFIIVPLQAVGNIIISCVCTAHEKFQLNPPNWQGVIVRGSCLLTKRDMHRFKMLCKDGHLIPEDYRIYEDWSATNKSQERYIRVKDGLLSEGEVQDMNDKENFYDEELYKERVRGFFLAYHQVVAYQRWLSFRPADLEHFREFEVSFFIAGNVTDHLHMPFCSNGIKF
jgi:hypothetical protein